MTAAIKAQLSAHKAAPAAPRPASGPGTRPAAVRPVAATKRPLPGPPKEQPGPKPGTPVRYATAGPLHAEQFPGEFRVTVTGPQPMLPALIAALDELVRLAKKQFIDPAP